MKIASKCLYFTTLYIMNEIIIYTQSGQAYICKHNPVYKSVCMLQDLFMQANNVKIATVSVKIFVGNKFHGRGTYTYR